MHSRIVTLCTKLIVKLHRLRGNCPKCVNRLLETSNHSFWRTSMMWLHGWNDVPPDSSQNQFRRKNYLFTIKDTRHGLSKRLNVTILMWPDHGWNRSSCKKLIDFSSIRKNIHGVEVHMTWTSCVIKHANKKLRDIPWAQYSRMQPVEVVNSHIIERFFWLWRHSEKRSVFDRLCCYFVDFSTNNTVVPDIHRNRTDFLYGINPLNNQTTLTDILRII